MTWAADLKRIRYLLRDPKGRLWSEELLRNLYNQAQDDLAREINFLQNVKAVASPPKFGMSYLHGFEEGYAGTGSTYQALRQNEAHYACCAAWEAQEAAGIDGDVSDRGTAAFTHPFEAWFATPNKEVPYPLPEDFGAMRAMFYDRDIVYGIGRNEVLWSDYSYVEHEGRTPSGYYRIDTVSNTFSVWPRPSDAVWDDEDTLPIGAVWAVTGAFELDELDTLEIGDEAVQFTREDDDQAWIFDWEEEVRDTTDPFYRGQWLFEVNVTTDGDVLVLAADAGTVTSSEGDTLSSPHGVAIEAIEAADNFLLLYDARPTHVNGPGDATGWPAYLRRYVRFRALERAYQANNDGNIPSLGKYWRARWEFGLQVLKRFYSLRREDRHYRLRPQSAPARRRNRHPRLPDAYPAV